MKTGIRGSRKVPVIMQMEALECGAACLAMILAYYGKWVPLEQVRSDCGVSRDGASAKNVLRAARSYHMTAKGFRYEPETLRKKGSFPCIIHWNFNHFVVLCGFSKKGALLNDPARGRVTVSWEEFDRSFTGICLMFSPEEGFEKGGSRRSILGFVKERLRGTGPAFLFVVLTGLIAAAAGILNPVFSRVFLDRILTGENPEWLPPLLGLMAVVAFCQISVSIIQAVHMSKIEGKLAIEANASFMWHVLRLPMEFFSQRLAGDLAVRQSSNEGIASSLIRQLAPSLLNFVMLAFYLLVMLRYSPILTAVGLLSVLINVTAARLISKRRVNITRVQMRDAGKLSGAATAGIEMIESIKASGAENGFFQRWAGYQASVNASNVRLTEENRFLAAVPGLIQTLAGAAVLLLGALLIMRGEFSIGALLAFQGFLQSFFTPFQSLVAVGQSLQEMRTKVERIEDVMNYAPDPETEERGGKQEEARKDGEADAVYAKLSGRLVMEHVTFGYSRLAPPIIEDFSLTLEPGRSVAFVGASGCGKSTLSKLISGLYRPWSGRILFDGKPREEISREILTGSIAVVDQDIILFEDTISNNIRLWDDSIEDFEVIMAARDAHIHETIMERDGGYDYRILEGGRDFSGGQRQRLEIARVLAQDPTILIMDEATSALDARTELLYSRIVPAGEAGLLVSLGVMLAGTAVSAALVGIVRQLALSRIETKLSVSVEAAVMARVLSLPAPFFKQFSAGELSSRMQGISQLCSAISGTVLGIGASSLFSLLYLGQVFSFAPSLAAPSLFITLLSLAVTTLSALLQVRFGKKQLQAAARNSGVVFSLFTGIQKIRLAGAERRAFAHWAEGYREQAEYQYASPAFVRAGGAIAAGITTAGSLLIYYSAAAGGVSAADYIAFSASFGMVSGALSSLASAGVLAAQISPLAEMAKPILQAEPEEAEGKQMIRRLSGGVELSHVSFRYVPDGPLILDNVSLKVRPGQYVAIVGETGCGKSTLMRLLLGFEKPWKGAVYYDGKVLSKVDLKSLRRHIGVVMQNGKLFQGDIYSNIVISAPQLSMDEAWEAAEMAGIADDIRAMPMGMHTIISEGGGGISGGQRQRLMIARAIAPKPKILMLDEATSALDNITQKKVSDSLEKLGSTRIVIAHRLSTIRRCDRILVMERGRITADGTFEELMETSEYFAGLVRRQQIDG